MFEKALNIRENANAIYSKFKVGAVIKTKSGIYYSGCNVESSSYGLSICAERVALFNALSEGEREFETILILADLKGEKQNVCRPCGACRQLLYDYARNIEVVMTNIEKDNCDIDILSNLLKNGFEI